MKAALSILSTALLLAGCTGGGSPRPQAVSRAPEPIAPRKVKSGVQDAVIGRDARALTGLLGRPARDVREANGRKLQFSNGVCVLDAYLYARKSGQDAVVTHVDTRKVDGTDMDRASCVAALAR